MSAADSEKFLKYILPHLSIVKNCRTSSDCYQVTNVYRLNGANHPYGVSNYSHFNKFILADGSVMFYTNYNGRCSITTEGVEKACGCFYYDVNGNKIFEGEYIKEKIKGKEEEYDEYGNLENFDEFLNQLK